MKLTDSIAKFLHKKEVTHVFGVSGGASLHLLHSVSEIKGIKLICPHHEQSAAMAADAYSRVTGKIGVAISTSGPGATNLITGICGSYYDSIPLLIITGQVASFRLSNGLGIRQFGFQETPIVDLCSKITKYSVQITEPNNIIYELEKAYCIAVEGRPGPVLIDIPDDIQRKIISTGNLKKFSRRIVTKTETKIKEDSLKKKLLIIQKKLEKSRRPIIVIGWGVYLSKTLFSVRELVEKLKIPVVLTWGAVDFLPRTHSLNAGTFGTHGTRYSNFSIQNSDFVLSLGSRLDTKSTGSPPSTFARGAWKSVVDIDKSELQKFKKVGLHVDCLIHSDLASFVKHATSILKEPDSSDWLKQIKKWKSKYPVFPKDSLSEKNFINPYRFLDTFYRKLRGGNQIFLDTGCTVAWTMQTAPVKKGTKIWHDNNNTAMGWALPASIAGGLVNPKSNTFCLVGDGSLMMNIQELATIKHLQLPIKIICFNNLGYSMIKQTQDQWLSSNYVASDNNRDLGFPEIIDVAKSFGLEVLSLTNDDKINSVIDEIIFSEKPIFCDIKVSPNFRVSPQVKYGRPNEDPEPFIDRDEFNKEMYVPILSVSKSGSD